MPFTGDSSDDSSDGEESMGVTVHNTPHHNPLYGKLMFDASLVYNDACM